MHIISGHLCPGPLFTPEAIQSSLKMANKQTQASKDSAQQEEWLEEALLRLDELHLQASLRGQSICLVLSF